MATIRLIPSAYTLSSTRRVTVTDETNMYNNTDHTANYCSIRGMNNTSNVYYCFIHGFNTGDVPSDAIVSNVSVKIRCYKNSYLATGSDYRLRLASTPASASAINNTTMTSDIGTTAAVYNIPIGSLSWGNIKSYGSNFSIEVPLMSTSNQYPYLYVYGAEIEVTYTVPVYHDVSPLYYKNGNSWSRYKFAYKKVNGAWVMQSPSDVIDFFKETRIVEKYGTIYLKG